MEPQTEYARLGTERIAYQVSGSGSIDLVLSAGTFGSIDLDWEDPMVAAMYRRLGSFCRLIRFDRRGSGASDPLPLRALPPWESYLEETGAVMDAVGSTRAAVMGLFDAGPMALLFAATFPERTTHLVLVNTAARLLAASDYPAGVPRDQAMTVIERIEATWGTEKQALQQVPSRAADEDFTRWFARYTRSIASPSAVRAYLEAMLFADARSVLGALHVPTLVLHRTDYALFRVHHGRYLAENIDGAQLVELPGSDGPLPWENPDMALDEIEEFLTGVRASADTDTALVTVLFCDLVGSTQLAESLGDHLWRELLDRHDRTVRSVLAAFGGRLVDTAGDGILATFSGPGRAIRGAFALRERLAQLGLATRIGIHTGEVQLRGHGIGGISVHIGARVMASAEPGEILVTRTVRDIIAGSHVALESRGSTTLKGVSGEWELYSVHE